MKEFHYLLFSLACFLSGPASAQFSYYQQEYDYEVQIPAGWDTLTYSPPLADTYHAGLYRIGYDDEYLLSLHVLFHFLEAPEIAVLPIEEVGRSLARETGVSRDYAAKDLATFIRQNDPGAMMVDSRRWAVFVKFLPPAEGQTIIGLAGYYQSRNGLLGIYCYASEDHFPAVQNDFLALLESVEPDRNHRQQLKEQELAREQEWEAQAAEREYYWERQEARERRNKALAGASVLVLLAAGGVWGFRYRKRRIAAKTPIERQSTGLGRIASTAGVLLLVVGALLFYFTLTGRFDLLFVDLFADASPLMRVVYGGIVGLVGGMVASLIWTGGKSLVFRSKRHFAVSATEKLEKDARPPVVYLRSFTDDEQLAQSYGQAQFVPMNLSSREEMIGRLMNQIGPFVAIGRPSEELPTPGAARMYLSDDRWKSEVDLLLQNACLVLIRAGRSEGLWWEFHQVFYRVSPERLVLVVPTDIDPAFFTRLKSECGIAISPPTLLSEEGKPYQLPEYYVAFADDWTPEVIIPPAGFEKDQTPGTLKEGLLHTFHPVTEQLGYSWKEKKKANYLTPFLLIVGLLVYFYFFGC